MIIGILLVLRLADKIRERGQVFPGLQALVGLLHFFPSFSRANGFSGICRNVEFSRLPFSSRLGHDLRNDDCATYRTRLNQYNPDRDFGRALTDFAIFCMFLNESQSIGVASHFWEEWGVWKRTKKDIIRAIFVAD